MRNRATRLAAPWVALVLVVAACGGGDAEDTTTTTGGTTTTADATTSTPASAEGSLDDCPDPLVIQTDWFPEPEHGALYQLTGGEGGIDPESGVFQGPLREDPGLTIEIRAGGPYIGNQPQTTMMYSDDSIFLAYINTDSQIASFSDFPSIAVVAPLEKNPQILMFDPETYDFETFSDIGESGAVVNVFAGQFYTEYLVGSGQLTAEQIDPSYGGSEARFIAENGALVQQGFVTQEPWNYEYVFTDWGRPVDWLLIHDSGYEIYSQALAIRPDKLDAAASSCLTAFVPLVQQAAVDFMADPGPVNDAILQAVEDLDSFWQLDPAGVVNTVEVMDELDIVGNGPNDTVGDFDLDRVQALIDQVRDIPAFGVTDVEASDIVTNEFIDPSIGF
jgi:hypothetical protein